MSAFNPELFLSATVDTPTERRAPLPVENPESPDKCYLAVIKDVKPRTWEGKTEKSAGKSGIAMDVELTITVLSTLQTSLGLPPELTLRDSIMLDLTPTGLIDNAKGRNGRMRLYRDAVNMNNPGDSFSFLKMLGRPVKVKIEHEVYNDNPQERVKTVLRP